MHTLVMQKSFTLLVSGISAVPFSIGELAARTKIPANIVAKIFISLVSSDWKVTEQQNQEKTPKNLEKQE